MQEYRYTGLSLAGRPVQGVVHASGYGDVKRRIQEIVKEHKININRIQKKSTFVYKVRKGVEKSIRGEQRAFSREEVNRALLNQGFQVISIHKKLFDFKQKVAINDIVIFINLCADLLREKFPYDEILQLLSNDTMNRTLREAIREIHKDLKMGKEGFQVYGRHEKVFGKFTTYMLSIASTSGNMLQVYESTAKYLTRDADFRKNIRSALFMPMIVFFAIIATFLFFIMYIFPQMTTMLAKYNVEIPPLTQGCLTMNEFIQEHNLVILAIIAIPSILLFKYFKTINGKIQLHQYMLKLPILGSLFHKLSIEIFSRVFHALYSGSGENINVIKIAAEACRNSYIEMKIKTEVIPSMLKEGKSFTECIEKAGVFSTNAIHRFRAGEESGTLKSSAMQLANYYEKETTHQMVRIVDFIHVAISVIVTGLIILLTLISSEIGFISPDTGSF